MKINHDMLSTHYVKGVTSLGINNYTVDKKVQVREHRWSSRN